MSNENSAIKICIAFVELHEKSIAEPAEDEINLSKTARDELTELTRFAYDAIHLIRDIGQPGRLLENIPLAKTTWGKFYIQEARNFIRDHSDQWDKFK